MRNFTAEERIYLQSIFEKRDNPKPLYVGNLFQLLAIRENVIVEIDKKQKTTFFLSGKLDALKTNDGTAAGSIKWFDTLYEVDNNLKRKTATLLFLLDYLEKNQLIYLFPHEDTQAFDNMGSPLVLNGDLYIKDYTNKYKFLNGDYFEYLFNKIDLVIIASEELIEFVKNGFKDAEQIRHRDNLTWQKRSLAVALGLGVLSLAVSLVSLIPENRKKQLFDTAFREDRFKFQGNLDNPVNQINRKMPAVNNKLKQNKMLDTKTSPSDTVKK